MKQVELQAVDSSEEIENVHGAIITRAFAYQRRTARPGYCWFVWDINGMTHYLKQEAEAKKAGVKFQERDYKKKFKKIQGAFEIELSFVKTHGEINVKNMIIVNLLNPKKFFK